MCFRRNKNILISGGYDRKIRLWDIDNQNKLLRNLLGHEGPVNALAISPDGKMLASGSSDKTVRLWDLEDLDKSPIVLPQEGGVLSVSFSPDGNVLAAAGNDLSILLWKTHSQQLSEEACKSVNRNMKPEEWKKYVGEDVPYRQTCPELLSAARNNVN